MRCIPIIRILTTIFFPAIFALQAIVNMNEDRDNCVLLSPKSNQLGTVDVALGFMLIPSIIIFVCMNLPLAFALDKHNMKEMNPNGNYLCFCILGCQKMCLFALFGFSSMFQLVCLGAALFLYWQSFLGKLADILSNVAMVLSGIIGLIYVSSR